MSIKATMKSVERARAHRQRYECELGHLEILDIMGSRFCDVLGKLTRSGTYYGAPAIAMAPMKRRFTSFV